MSLMASFRPPFLLATPRSGSTMFYWILLEYLAQTRGMEGRGEYFLGHHPIRDEGTQIATLRVASCCSILTEAQRAEVGEERLALLKKYYGRYFFKLFPNQIPHAIIHKLCESHGPVYLERRDLWDQFLSMAVSVASGIWSTKEGLKLPDTKLEYSECAEHLGEAVAGYRALKRSLPPGPVIVYEDFVGHMDCGRLLASLDWCEKIDLSRISFPPKQNLGSAAKLDLFRDPEKVISSYRNSILQDFQGQGS
jgi:hypothetical protein